MIELSYPGDLTDADELALQLSTTGLTRVEVAAKAVVALSVTERDAQPPGVVPGRMVLNTTIIRRRVAALRVLHALPHTGNDRHRPKAARPPVFDQLKPGSWSNYPS